MNRACLALLAAVGVLLHAAPALSARSLSTRGASAAASARCVALFPSAADLRSLRRAFARDRHVPAGPLLNRPGRLLLARCGAIEVSNPVFDPPANLAKECKHPSRSEVETCIRYEDQPWWERMGQRPWHAIGDEIPVCRELSRALRIFLRKRHFACSPAPTG